MIGQVIDGRYKIISRLGKGGMAYVYLADDLVDEKKVAFKVLQQQFSCRKQMEERFQREFELCAKLDHPNVVKIYSTGQLEDGSHYYTMEYLPTPDLEAVLARHKKLEQAHVLKIVSQVVSAFAAYHPHKIIHRDLKPGNLLLCADGRVVIVDFGLAKQTDRTALTETGALVGTPYYIAPEIIEGKRITSSADIYALGVMTYEMLTGERPFQANSLSELLNLVMAGKQPLPSARVSNLAPEWDHFVCKAMARRISDRYQSAQDMLPDLENLKSAIESGRTSLREKPSPAKPKPLHARDDYLNRYLPYVVTAVILGLLILVTFSSSIKKYDVIDLKLNLEPGGLRMQWKSSHAYETRVLLNGKAHPPTSRAAPLAKDHELAIGPLKEGYHKVAVLYPGGKTTLSKRIKITNPICELVAVTSHKDKQEAIFLAPAAARAKLLVKQGTKPPISAERRSADRWSLDLQPLLADGHKELHLIYGAGHQKVFSLSSVVKESAARLASNLQRRSGDRIVELVKGKEDRAFALAIDKAKIKRKSDELSAIELRDMRRELKGKFLKLELQGGGLLADYNLACQMAPLLFSGRLVELSTRRSLYRGMCIPIQLLNYAFSRKAPLFPLSPPPKIGDFTFGREPTIEPHKSIDIFIGKGEKPYVMGAPRMKLYDRPHYTLDEHFTVSNLHSLSRAEFVLHLRSFYSILLIMTINENSYILYDDPLFPTTAEIPIKMYQRVPISDLRIGRNSFALKAIRIFDDLSVRETIIYEIELKLAN